jgi:tetratricopeptide (TPR) repeat protein
VCSSDLYRKWLDKAKDAFEDAVKIDPKSSAAYYFMGIAYRDAYIFDQSGQVFSKVIELKGDYVDQADTQWKLMQKIQRAMPGTMIGKKIALQDKITRAEAAALLMEEMKIDVLYEKRTQKKVDTSFQASDQGKAGITAVQTLPSDITGHPLKADVEGILKIGVKRLEVYPDGKFRPDELVDRAAYAMMIEDILIKVTGDNSLATKFIGTTSPFLDLRSDLPYFNAVMVVTSRGIMEPKDISIGEFGPFSPVPGADSLLIIRKFKEELKIF